MIQSQNPLFKGIFICGSAGLLWGLAFVIPKLLYSFSSIEITLGRYLFYGLVSFCALPFAKFNHLQKFRHNVWKKALLFAFAGNIGYYFFLVLGVKHIGAPITILIIGALPVTVSIYGGWLKKEFSFFHLLPSILLIFGGLICMNLPLVFENDGVVHQPSDLVIGYFSCFAALGLWTWYSGDNAQFLKTHPEISPASWSTVVGVATFILVVFFILLLMTINGGTAIPHKFFEFNETLLYFVAGVFILGVAVSWGGTLLWNWGSRLLPVTLAGQLIVFEPISGWTYVFLIDARFPTSYELSGIVLMVTGVLTGIHLAHRHIRILPSV